MPRRRRTQRKVKSTSHTLSYQCVTGLTTTLGEIKLLPSHFGIPIDRPCRIAKITVVASTPTTLGSVYSYTIENQVDIADATTRSLTYIISNVPRAVHLRNPRSTDFAYLTSTASLTVITVTNGFKDVPDDIKTCFEVRVTMEFKHAQIRRLPAYHVFSGSSSSELADSFSNLSVTSRRASL